MLIHKASVGISSSHQGILLSHLLQLYLTTVLASGGKGIYTARLKQKGDRLLYIMACCCIPTLRSRFKYTVKVYAFNTHVVFVFALLFTTSYMMGMYWHLQRAHEWKNNNLICPFFKYPSVFLFIMLSSVIADISGHILYQALLHADRSH